MSLYPPQQFRKTEFTHRIGTRADQPLAADVLIGTLYFVTDEFVIERSDGTVWASYGGTGAVGATTLNVPDTIVKRDAGGSFFAQNITSDGDLYTLGSATVDGSLNTGSIANTGQLDNDGIANFIGEVIIQSTLSVKNTGAAAIIGQLTLIAGTLTVNTTAITATALIFLQRKTAGGTIGNITYTQVDDTSFTVTSDNALDTSTFNWWIIEQF